MRDGWEAEAGKWAEFARTPGHDSSHDDINLPALEAAGLLTEAIRETRAPDGVVANNPGQRRWQRIPLSLHFRAVKP